MPKWDCKDCFVSILVNYQDLPKSYISNFENIEALYKRFKRSLLLGIELLFLVHLDFGHSATPWDLFFLINLLSKSSCISFDKIPITLDSFGLV